MKVKSKPLPSLKRQRLRRNKLEITIEEELEMKTTVEPDDDYYFEDPSNIGLPLHELD